VKDFLRRFSGFLFFLVLINVLIIAGGCILVSLAEMQVRFGDIIVLSLAFSIISLVTITIFRRGQSRDPEAQTMHTLFSIGLKFLLDLVLALLYFIVAKKNSLQYVFIFFVLYLTLTLFSVIYILKTLKSKPL
jgi:hypothetical protein